MISLNIWIGDDFVGTYAVDAEDARAAGKKFARAWCEHLRAVYRGTQGWPRATVMDARLVSPFRKAREGLTLVPDEENPRLFGAFLEADPGFFRAVDDRWNPDHSRHWWAGAPPRFMENPFA